MTDESVEEWLGLILGETHEGVSSTNGELIVTLGKSTPPVSLTAKQVEELRWSRKFPTLAGLGLEKHVGIVWQDYAEYLIFLENWGEWPEGQELRFNIGQARISVGRVSPLIVLLLQPIYRDKDVGQYDFVEYSSIRIEGAKRPADVVHQVLFHLNSAYLIPLRTAVVLRHLINPDEVDWGPPSERGAKLARRRVRTRKPMKALEPIILFNDAAASYGHQCFLGHYRVLEYFFRRAVLVEIGKVRHDPSKTEEDILNLASIAREQEQLLNLLTSTLTAAEKKRLLEFAHRKRLTAKPLMALLGEKMYAFRNSLVHAKEPQISRTTLPNPLDVDRWTDSWNYVVGVCSAAAIKRLNVTE